MTVRIGHISDTHISGEFPQRTADLEKCVQRLNAAVPQPDVVIHTGDIVDYGQAGQYALARPVLDKLRSPFYVMAGNRDSRQEMRRAFSDQDYLPANRPFLQYSVEHLAIRLVVLDTLFEGEKKGQLCADRLQHLQEMLAADTTRPVAVFLHHPPFEAPGVPDPFQYVNWDEVEQFHAILGRFDNIAGVYCGHLHRNIEASIGGVPVSSVSCAAGDLRWGVANEADRSLPMFRILEFK